MATAEPKKTTRKAPAAKAKPAAPRAPRKAPQIIRNLRGTVVHLRMYSVSPKDPFRVELKPRGQQGDTTVVPVALQDDPTYLQGLGVLFETITKSEFADIKEGYAPVGYLARTDAPKVERPADTTIMTANDWDGKGRRTPEDRNIVRKDGTGQNLVDLPGADSGLHETIRQAQRAGESALGEDVDLQSRRVVIERVKGE